MLELAKPFSASVSRQIYHCKQLLKKKHNFKKLKWVDCVKIYVRKTKLVIKFILKKSLEKQLILSVI